MVDRQMRAAAMVLAMAAAAAAHAADDRRFTVQGLAPALAGMTLEQADKVLGQPLQAEKPATTGTPTATATAASATGSAAKPNTAAPAGACHYRSTTRQPGVRYAVQQGRILRSETRDARYSTASGLKVGDTLARAQKLYGARLVTSPHPYFDKGKSLAVYSSDKKYALVMEANDEGRIITMRGGQVPQVLSLEGCS
jgi:hypothetical protein